MICFGGSLSSRTEPLMPGRVGLKEVEDMSTGPTVGSSLARAGLVRPEQAREFYAQLFGWETEVFKPGELDYAMISSGGRPTAVSGRRPACRGRKRRAAARAKNHRW